jgi:transcriptional regulator with XRE-family HTH domain
MNWGEALRAFRVRNNIKQEAAAHMLGVSQAYVSRIESGSQEPSPNVEKRLRTLLTAPAHRPVFEYIKALVSRSPHVTFLLSFKADEIWVEAASPAALALTVRLHASAPELVVGQPMKLGDRPEVLGTVERVIADGGFEGRVAFVDTIWSAPLEESGETLFFRNTLVPMRDEMTRWFVHGTTRLITQAEYQRLNSEWGGLFRFEIYADDASETGASG